MKPIPAIVEPAQDHAAEQVIAWREEERRAETNGARFEQQAATERATAAARRLQIGELLVKQRGKWPQSGPRAAGWGLWLAKARIDDSTAWRYMEAWKVRNAQGDDVGDPSQSRDVRGNNDEFADRDAKPTNVNGGSGEQPRGAWCTPKPWADAVGPWDLDPFSNPRSHIVASVRCMLEDGGDGMASDEPGHYRSGSHGTGIAKAKTRVWIQPPYERGFVERVIAHYGHTRFCALLRWSPDTGWFEQLWPLVKVVAFPIGERLDFDPPPGVPESSTPHAHAFHFSDPRDVTDEIARRCIVLARHEALRLVR